MESLSGSNIPISIVGYRMEEEAEVIPVSEVEFDAKQAKELAKAKEKDAKEAKKFDEKVKKVEYDLKIQQMDMATMLKIMQRQEEMKKNYEKSRDGVTGR